MGASAGRHSFGAHLQTDFSGGTSYADVGEVVEITGPGISVSSTDITNLNSPSAAKEKLPGFIDAGEVTFTINYVAAAYAALLGGLRKKLNWRIQFPVPTGQSVADVLTFVAHLTKLPVKIPLDNKVECDSVTVDISGLPVFVQGS